MKRRLIATIILIFSLLISTIIVSSCATSKEGHEPETGSLMESEEVNDPTGSDVVGNSIDPRDTNDSANTEEESSAQLISPVNAFDIFETQYPDAKIKEVVLDLEKGSYVYKIKGYAGSEKYEIQIDGYSGEILKTEIEINTFSKGDITREHIEKVSTLLEAALKDAGAGAYVHEWELEYDDGIYELEVEIKTSESKYIEYEYNLDTGELLEKKLA